MSGDSGSDQFPLMLAENNFSEHNRTNTTHHIAQVAIALLFPGVESCSQPMTTSFLDLFVAGLILALIQAVAAIPWLWGLDPRGFRRWIKDPTFLGYTAGVILGVAIVLAWFMSELR